MPQNTILCRVCLTTKVPMFSMANTPLQIVYENITNLPLNTSDMKPVIVCYICCALLKKCNKLMLTSAESEKMLTQILDKHPNAIKSSKKLLTLVKRKTNGLYRSLCVTPVDCIDTFAFNTPIKIKNEPNIENNFNVELQNVQTTVKEEINSDEYIEPSFNTPINNEPENGSVFRKESHDLFKELDYEAYENPAQVPNETEDFNDKELDLNDDGVLRSIHMEQKCYSLNTKEIAEEQRQNENLLLITKKQHSAIGHKRKCPNEKLLDNTGEKLIECNLLLDKKLSTRSRHETFPGDDVGNGELRKSSPEKPHKLEQNSIGKYFECNECQHRFKLKGHLTRHMYQHTGNRVKTSFECNICHRILSYRHSLRRHMRTHTGEKPYACNFCPSQFNDQSVLTNHLRTHTGEKPFKCDVCDRGFKQINDLRRHARIHTGEKPYKCDICQQKFNEKSKVVRHSKKHYGEKLTKRNFTKLLNSY